MKTQLAHTLTLGNKKYTYSLKQVSAETTHLVCEAANINQEFLNEDIPALLTDLPNLISAEKEYLTTQSEVIRFRVSAEDKKIIEQKAVKEGYTSVSSFLRALSLGQA